MLREILFSAITVAWGASSEAQSIPNPAHSCLVSICGPVDMVQPYSYQLEKEKALEKEMEAHDNTQAQIEYPQAIVSDIINLIEQERDIEKRALNQEDGSEVALQRLEEAYFYEREILRSDDWRRCYIWYQLTYPDVDQVERARREVPDKVKAMEADIENLFGRFTSGIEAIYIDLPPNKELLKDHLRQLRQSIQDRIDLLKKGDLQSAVIAKLVLDSSAEIEEFQRYLKSSCEAIYDRDPKGDEYFPIGILRLSKMTVRGKPESREGVIRHELAHYVIQQMKYYEPKIVERFEDCLSRQHSEPQSKDQLEEDFADLLAMINWKQNFFCQRLAVDATRGEYSDNAMYSDPEDTHSSELFRILHLEFMKQGSLSQPCQDYLDEIRYPARFRHCLNLSSCGIF